jgi:hypothetical protein
MNLLKALLQSVMALSLFAAVGTAQADDNVAADTFSADDSVALAYQPDYGRGGWDRGRGRWDRDHGRGGHGGYGYSFSVQRYPISGQQVVDCQDGSLGGRYNSYVESCVDIGDGRNHSCYQVSQTACMAVEGKGNGGSAGCLANCRSR